MTDESNRTIYLLRQYAENACTDAEADELFDTIKASLEDAALYQFLEEEWQKLQPAVEKEPDWNRIYQTIIARPPVVESSRPRVMRIWKWVAAACIIIAIAIVGVLNNNRKPAPPPVATTNDVQAPKETRAVITLANGSKVYLDSVENGTIAQESNVNVVKTEDGKITYKPVTLSGVEASTVAYNTLSNPRGSKVIDMQLSDGSHVWLNSGSSIKYPVAFVGKERVVEITGEAYFEVKHNAQQPFKVHLPNGSMVEDIGTSFNVNAYSDEADIRTTLIEGSVRVYASTPLSMTRKGVTLQPGQQAAVTLSGVEGRTAGTVTTRKNVDLEEVMAWKNGKFYFHSADLGYILRQAQRWYDVDVVYETKIEKRFNGEIDHNTNLSNLLKALELSGDVKFRIEGKRIIVTK
jgi:ferric-dicitrate binding protein FerR (iron transport regulator)